MSGRDARKMGTKKMHQKDGRLPHLFFFFKRPSFSFLFHGHIAHRPPIFFFYDAHVLHKILMGEFWLDGAVHCSGVWGGGGRATNCGIFY